MAITISGDSPNFSSATITTLTNTTISDGTNSTSSTNCIQGSAKAWVNFTSTTVRASYNVTSVTRASAGQYTVNFTNAFSDTNYAVVANASSTQSNTYVVIGVYTPSNTSYSSKTTSACAINAFSPAIANYDPYECDIAFFR